MFQQKDRLCEENRFFFFPTSYTFSSLTQWFTWTYFHSETLTETNWASLPAAVRKVLWISSRWRKKKIKFLLVGFLFFFFLLIVFQNQKKNILSENNKGKKIKQLNMRHDSERHKTNTQRKKCLKCTSYTQIYHFITPGVRTHAVTLTPQICLKKASLSADLYIIHSNVAIFLSSAQPVTYNNTVQTTSSVSTLFYILLLQPDGPETSFVHSQWYCGWTDPEHRKDVI